MNELIPIEHFYRLVRFWWLIMLTGLIGGGVGAMIQYSQTPIYESKSIFYVTIDLMTLQSLNLRADQYQYNEDLALNVTYVILLSPELISKVVGECSLQGISISEGELINNNTVERKHAFWELRFRHPDPQVSHDVTNLWAEKAYETMLNWSRAEKAPRYVIFTPPTLASMPMESVNYGLNRLMLAGFLIGLMAGILIIEIYTHFSR